MVDEDLFHEGNPRMEHIPDQVLGWSSLAHIYLMPNSISNGTLCDLQISVGSGYFKEA